MLSEITLQIPIYKQRGVDTTDHGGEINESIVWNPIAYLSTQRQLGRSSFSFYSSKSCKETWRVFPSPGMKFRTGDK